MSYSILKSAGIPPAEVQVKQDIAEIKAQIKECTDPDERIRLINKLNSAMTDFSIKMERMRRR